MNLWHYIYPSDFEKELDDVVQVDDIVGGYFKNHKEIYFNLSDYNSELEGHEIIHQGLHESDINHVSSSCAEIDILKDKHFIFTWSIFP